MKTTIELSDALLKAARRNARERGITLRAIVEEGLRMVLGKSDASRKKFRLRRASFAGEKEVDVRDWHEIRDLTYRGRGS